MRNTSAIAFFAIAILAGLAAAMYAMTQLASKSGPASGKVVVAAIDIEMGAKVTPAMLSRLDWPGSPTPVGAFHDLQELRDRVARVGILRGEPLLESKLAPKGALSGLSAAIKEGKRALTVRVNDVAGVAGNVLPGTYVDVIVNMKRLKNITDPEDKRISKTVLEHVLVLAVPQETGGIEGKMRKTNAVTLEMTPEDAEKLDLARSVGTLSLVLRNQFDQQALDSAGVTKKNLLGPAELDEVATKAESKVVQVKPVVRRKRTETTPVVSAMCVEVYQYGSQSHRCFE